MTSVQDGMACFGTGVEQIVQESVSALGVHYPYLLLCPYLLTCDCRAYLEREGLLSG